MSQHSERKANFLRSLNLNREYLAKRRKSRHFHENVVKELVGALRTAGLRCFILSEYVRDARTPDAVVFDGRRLLALEVEQEKRYKASRSAISERLSFLNAKTGFFDETFVLFVRDGSTMKEIVERGMREISPQKIKLHS